MTHHEAMNAPIPRESLHRISAIDNFADASPTLDDGAFFPDEPPVTADGAMTLFQWAVLILVASAVIGFVAGVVSSVMPVLIAAWRLI